MADQIVGQSRPKQAGEIAAPGCHSNKVSLLLSACLSTSRWIFESLHTRLVLSFGKYAFQRLATSLRSASALGSFLRSENRAVFGNDPKQRLLPVHHSVEGPIGSKIFSLPGDPSKGTRRGSNGAVPLDRLDSCTR